MDVKMISKRYSTPTYIKAIGTLLFPAVFVVMLVMPIFELIPQDVYLNVFNVNGVATGSYESTQYTLFTMLANDYGNNIGFTVFMIQSILAVVCGVALLWVNRAKLAVIPAAVLMWEVIFSVFRSPAKLFTGVEFWTEMNKAGLASVDVSTVPDGGFVSRYAVDGKDCIFNTLGNYWMLWVCGLVLMAAVIAGVAVTKTLIEKQK